MRTALDDAREIAFALRRLEQRARKALPEAMIVTVSREALQAMRADPQIILHENLASPVLSMGEVRIGGVIFRALV